MAMSAYLPGFIKFTTSNKTSELHATEFVLSSQQSLSWSSNSPSFINPRACYLETPNQSAVCCSTCTVWHGPAALTTFVFGPVSDGLNRMLQQNI